MHAGGLRLGYLAGAGRDRPGLAERFGAVRPSVSLSASDIVDVEVIEGADRIRAVRQDLRACAPLRPAGGPGARMKPLGDFYSPGLPAALHVRIRPDRVPEVPTRRVAAGLWRTTTTHALLWSGPEFLVGVLHPRELLAVLGDAFPGATPAGGPDHHEPA